MKGRTASSIPWSGMISIVLFLAGVVLGLTVQSRLFLLAASGAFLPDLLRLFGILHDRDEFQAQAEADASQLAIVVAGIFVCLTIVLVDIGRISVGSMKSVLIITFILLVGTRFVAYNVRFWNPFRAAPRLFIVFVTANRR